MKYFVSKIIPKLSSFSKKLDKISVICDRKWKMLDDEGESTSYIFREKNELLIIKKGEVKKAKWEIINQNDILIEQETASFLFRQAFIDENIFVLNVDGTGSYVYFVDGEKTDVKNIEQLESLLKGKYLPEPKQTIIQNNFEKKESGHTSSDNGNGGLYIALFIFFSFIVFCSVFAFINTTDKKSDSNEDIKNRLQTEKKAANKEFVEKSIVESIEDGMKKYVYQNENIQEYYYVKEVLLVINNDSQNSIMLSQVKLQYPELLKERDEFSLFLIESMYLPLGWENNSEKIISLAKDFYDKGIKKDFCALIIGKISKYSSGIDGKNHLTAIKWFKNSETISAYLNIASYYENGVASGGYFPEIIIKRNKKEALKWYKKAADLGSAEAKEKVNLLSL